MEVNTSTWFNSQVVIRKDTENYELSTCNYEANFKYTMDAEQLTCKSLGSLVLLESTQDYSCHWYFQAGFLASYRLRCLMRMAEMEN